MPGVRAIGHRRIGLPGDQVGLRLGLVRDEVRATVLELLAEERRPLRPGLGGAQQGRARVLVADDDGRLEVVPGPPVDVEHDGPPAQPLADERGDALQHAVEILAPANAMGGLIRLAQRSEQGEMGAGHRGDLPLLIGCGEARLERHR